VLGAVLLTLLFVGSTRFTESITKSKYPEYADYQARVSAVVPWFPRRARTEVPA
jgi:steroid 5-alpha reductase family enzyme